MRNNINKQNSIQKEIKKRLKSECLLPLHVESFVLQFAIHKFEIMIHRIIILPVVLYRCEIWLLTLTEECRLRGFENRVLRGIFEPKRD